MFKHTMDSPLFTIDFDDLCTPMATGECIDWLLVMGGARRIDDVTTPTNDAAPLLLLHLPSTKLYSLDAIPICTCTNDYAYL